MSAPRLTAEDAYDPDMLERVSARMARALGDYLRETSKRDIPLSEASSPEDVLERVRESLPRQGVGVDAAVERFIEVYLGFANRLAHPRYIGHQVAPPLPLTAAVDLISSGVNNGAAIWEMSPSGTVLEHLVLEWFADLIGWSWPATPGLEGAGGSFVDGGTLGNLTALAAARAHAYPRAWDEGFDPRGAAIICATTAHYCVERAAGIFGMGRAGLVTAPTSQGRLTAEAAREACARARAGGREPFALVGCAGSTAVGAVDDLVALAEVAREEDVWFHVDAAHAGAFLLSNELRPLLAGLELADSVTIDLHKMMFQPISTAMVLCRDSRRLRAAFSQEQSYVFHPRSDGPVWDQGPHTFQCSRRLDVARAWTTLQAYGADGVADLQEHCVRVAREAAVAIVAHDELELALDPATNIVCFRHRVEGLAGDALDEHNALLRERVNRGREAFVTATTFDGARWLRFTVINPRTTRADVEDVLALVVRAGRSLAGARPPVSK